MTRRLLVIAVLVALTSAGALNAAPAKQALSIPISGTFTDAAGGKGTFNGTFRLVEFVVNGPQIMATGYVSGTLKDSTGIPLGSVFKSVAIPTSVTSGSDSVRRSGRLSVEVNATCDILNLVLGPLSLNLLGLTVDLNQVVLDIAAVTGAGNLLGNLLCAVVSLLDGAGALIDISQLLNRILDILGGLLG